MTMKPSNEQIPGTMQTECWRGERQFEWDEISFAEEIVVDDNLLNFYIPIRFDAAAVFGKPVERLGPDDSFDVYANYALDEGAISEYLEIMVKYHDGVEDVAMYHLTPMEQEMFLRKMDEYCMSTQGQSIEEICQKHQQNMEQTI